MCYFFGCIIYIYMCIYIYTSIVKSFRLRFLHWASGVSFSGKWHFWIFWTCPFSQTVNFHDFWWFFKNGSPGQTTLPMEKVSKFYAKLRYQCPQMSHLSPNSWGQTSNIVPWPECSPEVSWYVRFNFFTLFFTFVSHSGGMCYFFMLNIGWILQLSRVGFTGSATSILGA